MINILFKTLEIDIAYSVNSFIYVLRKLPILKDLFTNDIYDNLLLKKIVGIVGLIISMARAFAFKLLYFFIIYFVSSKLFSNIKTESFFHMYFFLTILGMFINNRLLNTSKKKYFSLIIFNIDDSLYLKTDIIHSIIKSIILNSIVIYIFISTIDIPNKIIITLLLTIFTVCIRLIGEVLNIIFYNKYNYIWYNNTPMYFTILLSIILISLLPYFGIFIPLHIIKIIIIIIIPLGIISFIYLMNIKNYKYIYKQISHNINVMDSQNEKGYIKQSLIEVKEKDKEINTKIIENKTGYNLFNTIFFERHKEILLRSAKKYSLVLMIIYIGLIYLMVRYSNYNNSIAELLNLKLSIFIIIMFFINRGSIITQAMFFNCDHAMLRYNFYRKPKVILELFKRRLLTVVKVNMLPALVIGIGNIILLFISRNHYSYLMIITTFLFIICLSIFFSVHYLVLYYLIQPFNKDMQIKKVSYSIITLMTYVICYKFSGLILSSLVLSIFGILFVIIYITISLILVYKIAPRTFKIN